MTEFLTKAVFTSMVEKAVLDKKMTYMDAILSICDKNDIDPEGVRKFISAPIRSKIEAEAKRLNLLPKESELEFEIIDKYPVVGE